LLLSPAAISVRFFIKQRAKAVTSPDGNR